MKIGEPQHEIYIEPIELPEPLREEPSIQPEEIPAEEPVKAWGIKAWVEHRDNSNTGVSYR